MKNLVNEVLENCISELRNEHYKEQIKIVEKLDSGDIYKTKLYPIEKNKSLDEVMTETKKEGAKLMLESIYSIAKNPMEINFKPIDLSESDLHKFPGIRDSIRFRKKGLKLI